MSRLQIHSITDLNFGKHQGTSFQDLNHDFVVFYGANESGKSTIAEYLTWTLGGPWRTAALGSERFRSLNSDQVSGRLVGALGDETLDIDAKFKIKASGNPNDLRSGNVGKRSVAANEFINLFNGLAVDDFRWIYRLYGVELGSVGTAENFSNLFSNFTMGNAATSGNPRERAKELSTRADKLDKERKDIDKAIRLLTNQIKDAKKVPDEISRWQSDLSKIEDDLKTLNAELAVLRGQQTLIVRARNGLGAITKQDRAQQELSHLDSVPSKWEEVIPLATEIRRVQSELENVEQKLANAKNEVARCSVKIGVTNDVLIGQTLTATERQRLQSAAQSVETSATNLTKADLDIADLDRRVSAISSEINGKAPLVGLSPTNIDSVGPQSQFTDLQGPAAVWSQTSQDFTSIESSLAGAQAQLDEVSIQKDPGLSTSKAKLNPALLVSALILVGGLSLINPIISLVGALGAAIAIALMSKRETTGQPTSGDQAGRIREAQTKVAQAQSDLAAAKIKRDNAANRVTEPLAKLGAAILTADNAGSLLNQLADLAGKVADRQSLYRQLSDARETRKRLETVLAESNEELIGLLHNRQIIAIPDMSVFGIWLTDYENAIIAHQSLTSFAETFATVQSKRDALLIPIAEQIVGLPWPMINESLTTYESLASKIKLAKDSLRDSDIEVAAAGMNVPEIRVLLEQFPSLESLNDQETYLTEQINEISREHEQRIILRTEIQGQIKEKQNAEVLPSLQLDLGEKEEALEEVIRDHEAHSLAASMLEEMINRFERENQDPLIQQAQRLICKVVPDWGSLMYSRDAGGKVIIERDGTGGKLIDNRLSDGGRALLYLGIRLAFAEKDAERRGIHLPLICDDPLIHFDDERTSAAIKLLDDMSKSHQVFMFTCETSTRDLARDHGAKIIELPRH